MRPLIIFLTGGTILALQLIASRIMTPYFGVSLFIWTSILSITLLFLALGYAAGGRLTRVWARPRLDLAFQLAPGLSALWLVAACRLYPAVFRPLALWDLLGGSFVACLILLSGPLLLLSALNPLLVALNRDAAAGDDGGSGWVFFVSTIGSVAGVLVCAFLIIPYAGNRDAVLLLAAALSLTGLLRRRGDGPLARRHRLALAVLSAVGLVSTGLLAEVPGGAVRTARDGDGNTWTVLAEAPSAFGGLKVVSIADPAGVAPVRALLRDGLVQNAMAADGRSDALFAYALENLALSAVPAPKRALVLGLGAGFVPMALAARGVSVDVVEIDPKVVEVAGRHFGFRAGAVGVHTEDARTFVRRCAEPYDIVLVDLFNGDGMPEHLVTLEFMTDLANCLTPGGAVAANTFFATGNPLSQRLLIATMTRVFGRVLFLPEDTGAELSNGYLLASRTAPLDRRAVGTDGLPDDLRPVFVRALRNGRVIAAGDATLAGLAPLTDDANAWSRVGTDFQVAFRRHLLRQTPAEILLN
ncbi:spermidine synthase [Azospirillum sp.]|uniref:spermidine synthase n=1 Tax=Azospirillum sp. TaxID=34012 RepID=UPI003D762467